MVLQGGSQDAELPVGLEATKGLLRLQHAGGGPPEGHLGMAPALNVALDDADGERIVASLGISDSLDVEDRAAS